MTKPKTRVEGLVGDVDVPAEISDEGVVAKAAPSPLQKLKIIHHRNAEQTTCSSEHVWQTCVRC